MLHHARVTFTVLAILTLVVMASTAGLAVSGRSSDRKIERIVTLFVATRSGEMLAGSDVVVAAEKAGLQFGDMGIFHRMASGKASEGPVFSMANMVKPGSFDMSKLDALETPGVTLFMTLPGPLAAQLETRITESMSEIHARPNGLVAMCTITALDISGTAIRASVAHGRSPRYLLPDSVLDYIRRHQLYKDLDAG